VKIDKFSSSVCMLEASMCVSRNTPFSSEDVKVVQVTELLSAEETKLFKRKRMEIVWCQKPCKKTSVRPKASKRTQRETWNSDAL